MRFLIAAAVCFPLSALGAVPSSLKLSESQEGYTHAMLIRDNKAECVSSLRGKPYLLPDFAGSALNNRKSSNQETAPALSGFPACNEKQESFVSHLAKNMAPGPVQTAGFWFPAYLAMAYGVNCIASYQTVQSAFNPKAIAALYAASTFITFFLPYVSIKSPFICAGASGAVAYFTGQIDNTLEQINKALEQIELPSVISPASQPLLQESPYLKSVVTVYAMQQYSGSGFFVDKDKVITNNHVVQPLLESIKKAFSQEDSPGATIEKSRASSDQPDQITNEPEEKTIDIIIQLADGTKIPALKILAQDKKRDLALLLVNSPIGTPVKMGDSSSLELLDKVVIAGAPQGFDNTLAEGEISQVRETEEGVVFIQYSAPTSKGNSGGALFLKESQALIGVPSMTLPHLIPFLPPPQNMNFAIPVNDVKKFLRENGWTAPNTP